MSIFMSPGVGKTFKNFKDEDHPNLLKCVGKTFKNFKDEDHPNLLKCPFPDESCNLLKHHFINHEKCFVESSNAKMLNHTSHLHQLIRFGTHSSLREKSVSLHDPMKRSELLCDGCVKPVTTLPFYKCSQSCDFVLHEWCVRLPSEIPNHPLHPKHTLVLLTKYHWTFFYCDVCSLPSNGFMYDCAQCNFRIDINCTFIPEKITHEAHPNHLLSRINASVNLADEVNSEFDAFTEACQAVYDASNPKVHRTRVEGDHYGAHDRLVMAYFSENPQYDKATFRDRFRMSRRLFTKIIREFVNWHTDAFLILLMQMGGTTARDSLRIFCKVIRNLYGEEFLRKLTYTDMEKLYAYHDEKHEFPVMLGSIDCTHWPWANCPVAFRAQFSRGDHGPDPYILLETIASNDLWIWHAFFGVSGMNNDVNVLRQSPLFNDLKSGRAPDVSFVANNVPYKRGYYLTDGIYIESPCYLKMSGNEDHHRQGRRFAAGGNGHDGRDPRDVEIERLRQRVRDLEIQHEIRQIRKRIRELELQREMRKETESRYVVRDDVNEEEEYPSFDSYPRSFEPI
nr:zinc finger, PHD-type [Tanacetum cinerariifolium]